jgi:hypothetical protein
MKSVARRSRGACFTGEVIDRRVVVVGAAFPAF